MNVLLDTNVVLDTLMQRQPFCSESNLIFDLAGENRFRACLVASTLTDIYYLSRKRMTLERARTNMSYLLELFQILPVDGEDCAEALDSRNPDFEDALLEACARKSGMDRIITRDADFLNNCSFAISPAAFLEKLQNS